MRFLCDGLEAKGQLDPELCQRPWYLHGAGECVIAFERPGGLNLCEAIVTATNVDASHVWISSDPVPPEEGWPT